MLQVAEVYAIVNQKGGVGKTTTAVNLAACAAQAGSRTLLIDLDAQGNATSGLGVDRSSLPACVYDVLIAPDSEGAAASLRDVTVPTRIPRLDIAPATIDLAAADLRLANAIARETRLRRALTPVRAYYDLILVDTAPSLGILTVNSLSAADAVLIPIQCEYYALEGLSQLLEIVDLVRAELNPALRIAGAILTMFDARTRLAADVVEEVRQNFPGHVFATVIPRNVRLAEAPSHGMPAVVYSPDCAGSLAYKRLYQEVFGHETPSAGEGAVGTPLGGAVEDDRNGHGD